MALTVSFGNGGNSQRTTLSEAGNDQVLTGPSVSESSAGNNNLGENVPGAQQNVSSVPVGGSGSGGSVDVGFNGEGAYTFDVNSGWNSVKNAEAKSTGASGERVVFTDFVQVDVDFTAARSASEVTVENVKRTNILTGAGNDTISVTLSTNDAGWQNLSNIKAGAGNDTITLAQGVFVQGTNYGNASVLDGHFTTSTVDGGAGKDSIDLGGIDGGLTFLSSTITGGAGNDDITGSAGKDTFFFGTENTGTDIIHGFQAGVDEFSYAAGVTATATADGFSLSNGGRIILEA